jgi:hypothetical protein
MKVPALHAPPYRDRFIVDAFEKGESSLENGCMTPGVRAQELGGHEIARPPRFGGTDHQPSR